MVTVLCVATLGVVVVVIVVGCIQIASIYIYIFFLVVLLLQCLVTVACCKHFAATWRCCSFCCFYLFIFLVYFSYCWAKSAKTTSLSGKHKQRQRHTERDRNIVQERDGDKGSYLKKIPFKAKLNLFFFKLIIYFLLFNFLNFKYNFY